jgi:broad specificity phosphatase PhoE
MKRNSTPGARPLLRHKLPLLPAGHVRLFLCRHGETQANKESIIQGHTLESSLTVHGAKQASELCRAFAGIPLGRAYASSLKRAQQTVRLTVFTQTLPLVNEPGTPKTEARTAV